MFSTKEVPSSSSIFSAYASMAGSLMLARSIAKDLIPQPIRRYLLSTVQSFFRSRSSTLTLVIHELKGMVNNKIYEASAVYLGSKAGPHTKRLNISQHPKEMKFTIQLEPGERIVDYCQGVELQWKFVSVQSERKDTPRDESPSATERRYLKLSFEQKHLELVVSSYLPCVIEKAEKIKKDRKLLRIFTLNNSRNYKGIKWDSTNFEHPANFETLAIDPKLKDLIVEDLNRFMERREFYKRVGKAWKRGYLLYGPPGTGKSSLVAAMANYLKFNIYDLQLSNILTDSDLRRLLLSTGNRSILVIEDIDCSIEFPQERAEPGVEKVKERSVLLTLSGLLNFIDGLWSSCGEERVIIFTTNHKERLDPALLRPGRMDMHIHMPYCTFQSFKILASNYLELPRGKQHPLLGEIEPMIETAEVTPAQVAEELMKSEDADVALDGMVKLLKRKKLDGLDSGGPGGDGGGDKTGIQENKKAKLDKEQKGEVLVKPNKKKYTRRKRT